MSIILAARKFASAAHLGQTRKYTGEPYINHPVNVAHLVLAVTIDSEIIAAALLHDVVEDTPVTSTDISKEFGIRVESIVSDLTDISKQEDGNRKVRKAIDLQHTAKASPEAKTIKLADLIDNSESIIKNDPKFAKVYMLEKKALLNVLGEGDEELHRQASYIVEMYYKSQG